MPNLLFEICNEPNGKTTWEDIVSYSNEIIPVITQNIPDAVIIVGTPVYDQQLVPAIKRPLDFSNVMYCLHFYTATHKEDLQNELELAVDAGLPVFISECGICEYAGDGRIDFGSARQWFTYLNEHKISYTIWSLSNKDETSAFFKPRTNPLKHIEDKDISTSGLFVRELIRGKNPQTISTATETVEKEKISKLETFVDTSLGNDGYKSLHSYLKFACISVAIICATFLLRILF